MTYLDRFIHTREVRSHWFKPGTFWDQMFVGAEKLRTEPVHNCIVVALDPGETTGVAIHIPELSNKILFQVPTKEVESGYKLLEDLFSCLQYYISGDCKEIRVICEDYKVYSWKADDHKWAGLHTPQFIGAIRVLAMKFNAPIKFQMAQVGKKFCTDELLKKWGIYEPGMKHARDAQRHLMHYLLFGDKPST